MTTGLSVKFPWGRYHATPWGRNVNEGHPEWPPSPWRVLRALFATWKTRCAYLRVEDVEAALGQLAGSPTLHVPAMKPAHLRHYMPQIGHRSILKPDTTLTFDSFAVIDPRAPVVVEWNVDMAQAPRKALDEMAAELSYLGRSESICNAALVPRAGHLDAEYTELVSWRPAESGDRTDAELLCAREPLEMSNLLQSPDDVRRSGRLIPTGSYLVPYTKVEPTLKEVIATDWRPSCSAVRLAVHPRPRPTIANAVAVGELLRRSALKKHGTPSEALSGKRPSGHRRLDGHQHAHYISLATSDRLGASGPIGSLIVWASGGLSGSEIAALAQVRWLRAGPATSGVPDIAVAVAALGNIEHVAPDIVGPATRWVSHTPFAPGRHARQLPWHQHIQAQIKRELTLYRDLPEPASIEVRDDDARPYRRYRPKETMGASRRAAMVEIYFDRPVEGPIILGSLSHFGLGLFVPA